MSKALSSEATINAINGLTNGKRCEPSTSGYPEAALANIKRPPTTKQVQQPTYPLNLFYSLYQALV